MAFIQMNVFSQKLMRNVPVNVILPVDKMVFPGMPERENVPYKTLYLLHGILGNYMDWVNQTRVIRYAEDNNLAVIMPSGDNAFYVDQPDGNNFYGEFVGQELVELTRKMFPLSCKREDTYIGGLSMGGFGALRNGLKYHETFGAVIALSAALIMENIEKRNNESPAFMERRDYAQYVFGNLEKLKDSDKNPAWLVRHMKEERINFPKIFIACGNQDSLVCANREFAHLLEENEVDVSFEVGEGNHEWDFWDTYLKKALDWLPLEKSGMGIGSGNIGI